MLYLTRTILIAVGLMVLSVVPFVVAQDRPQILRPHELVTFSMSTGKEKRFALSMKEGSFAEITWLANEGVILSFQIKDSTGKKLTEVRSDDWDGDSVLFVAPRDDAYVLDVELETSSDTKSQQNVSLEFNDQFKLPADSKLKDTRKINGYDLKIMTYEDGNIVFVEKNKRLKYVMKSDGGLDYVGFSFADRLIPRMKVEEKRQAALVSNTLDKTGDGIPDVMIDHFSGGTHCCSRSYFINWGNKSNWLKLSIPAMLELLQSERIKRVV